MNQTPDVLWQNFITLAKTYPQDEGVRLTAHLARWMVEERRRLPADIPTVLHHIVQAVMPVIEPADSASGRESPPL